MENISIELIISNYSYYYKKWLNNYDDEEIDKECLYYIRQAVNEAELLGYDIYVDSDGRITIKKIK